VQAGSLVQPAVAVAVVAAVQAAHHQRHFLEALEVHFLEALEVEEKRMLQN
jgi:hypothetical protein